MAMTSPSSSTDDANPLVVVYTMNIYNCPEHVAQAAISNVSQQIQRPFPNQSAPNRLYIYSIKQLGELRGEATGGCSYYIYAVPPPCTNVFDFEIMINGERAPFRRENLVILQSNSSAPNAIHGQFVVKCKLPDVPGNSSATLFLKKAGEPEWKSSTFTIKNSKRGQSNNGNNSKRQCRSHEYSPTNLRINTALVSSPQSYFRTKESDLKFEKLMNGEVESVPLIVSPPKQEFGKSVNLKHSFVQTDSNRHIWKNLETSYYQKTPRLVVISGAKFTGKTTLVKQFYLHQFNKSDRRFDFFVFFNCKKTKKQEIWNLCTKLNHRTLLILDNCQDWKFIPKISKLNAQSMVIVTTQQKDLFTLTQPHSHFILHPLSSQQIACIAREMAPLLKEQSQNTLAQLFEDDPYFIKTFQQWFNRPDEKNDFQQESLNIVQLRINYLDQQRESLKKHDRLMFLALGLFTPDELWVSTVHTFWSYLANYAKLMYWNPMSSQVLLDELIDRRLIRLENISCSPSCVHDQKLLIADYLLEYCRGYCAEWVASSYSEFVKMNVTPKFVHLSLHSKATLVKFRESCQALLPSNISMYLRDNPIDLGDIFSWAILCMFFHKKHDHHECISFKLAKSCLGQFDVLYPFRTSHWTCPLLLSAISRSPDLAFFFLSLFRKADDVFKLLCDQYPFLMLDIVRAFFLPFQHQLLNQLIQKYIDNALRIRDQSGGKIDACLRIQLILSFATSRGQYRISTRQINSASKVQ